MVWFCHSRTSGRSLYHLAKTSSASGRETPKSLLRPWAVFPYLAMMKVMIDRM